MVTVLQTKKPRKMCSWCFWVPRAEKRPKTRLKKSKGKDDRKKVFFPQLFRPKVFDMDFPQKVFSGVFELPLLRNAQKRHKKIKKIKVHGTPFSGHLPDIRRFQKIS
jgi:hypothetical protein